MEPAAPSEPPSASPSPSPSPVEPAPLESAPVALAAAAPPVASPKTKPTDLLDPRALASAKARLAAESAHSVKLRSEVRELWDAAQRLLESDQPDASTSNARHALHLAALERALDAWAQSGAEHRDVLAPEPADLSLLSAVAAHAPVEHAWAEAAHRRLLAFVERDVEAVRTFQRRWLTFGGFAAIVTAALTLGGYRIISRAVEPTDFAKDKTWAYSSKWGDCHPEKNECNGYPTRVFFHTRDENSPWAVVDMLKPVIFTRVFVKNRSDMAMMRAIPLVVEVSNDGTNFTEVARQKEKFDTWTATFPEQKARWVRLRVDRFSTLHLEVVKVWP